MDSFKKDSSLKILSILCIVMSSKCALATHFYYASPFMGLLVTKSPFMNKM